MQRRLKRFVNKNTLVNYRGPAFIFIVAVIGLVVLIASHAAGPTVSVEPESVTPSGSAVLVNDTNASNGRFVKFGSSSSSSFVKVCGLQLCMNGQPFVIHGATGYGTYAQPATEIALAKQAKVNTLEIVEFETQFHELSDMMSTATWNRVDSVIAAAKQGGLHVILHLSSYGHSLQADGQVATKVDWQPFLSFIANRTNTVTGVKYKDEPTIAMLELFGEICYPGEVDSGCPAGTSGTATDMINFFHRTMTQWQALAPNILVSSGGFGHLNAADSNGIPWQTIVSDPANAVCDVEINSTGDLNGTVNKFTSYCKSINKPWFLSAWSSCYQPVTQTYPFFTKTDAEMAAHAQDMYDVQKGGAPATYASIGSDFWNLRDQGTGPSCSLSPSFPLTFAKVQANAP